MTDESNADESPDAADLDPEALDVDGLLDSILGEDAVLATAEADASGEDDDEPTVDDVDVVALLEERQQFLDAYQRTAADFDNFRKQSQRRLDDEVARSVGGFVERLLPVLDAIEAAQAHGNDGVDAVAAQLFSFLEKEGLERVSPTGEVFDPNIAEAVMHEPGEGEPTVSEVLRTGYMFRGRVVRAAMVKVSG